MSEKILKIVERLSEMFPRQDYQSKLDRYIASRYPATVGDVEHYQREFDRRQAGGLF